MFIVIAFVVATLSCWAAIAARETEIVHTEQNQIFNSTASGIQVIDVDFNILKEGLKPFSLTSTVLLGS